MTGPGHPPPALESPLSSGPEPATPDPLAALRAYQPAARWRLRELARVAAYLLEHGGLTGAALPTDRTIRFYVAKGLVRAPAGRGPAATYGYRQLVEVLAVKLRQADGVALEALRREVAGAEVEALERDVAGRLGVWIPPVERLRPLLADDAARAPGAAAALSVAPATLVRRITVEPGVELLVELAHPLARLAGGEATLAEAVRRALAALRGARPPLSPPVPPAPDPGDAS